VTELRPDMLFVCPPGGTLQTRRRGRRLRRRRDPRAIGLVGPGRVHARPAIETVGKQVLEQCVVLGCAVAELGAIEPGRHEALPHQA